MPWTSPITWSPNQIVTAADLNAHLRDNMAYVHSGKPAVNHRLTAGDFVTAAAGYADVDTITISTTTGRVLVMASFTIFAAAGHSVDFGVLMDGSYRHCNYQMLADGNMRVAGFCDVIAGLTIGSHMFTFQLAPWSSSTTIRRQAGWPFHFSVMEI